MPKEYAPGLWYSRVLPGGLDRHAELVTQVMASINAARSNMKGVSPDVLRQQQDAVAWLVEALTQAEAHLPPEALILPRSPDKYTASVQYPVPHGYKAVTRALEALQARGWLDTTPGMEGRGFTRIRPAGSLREHCRELAYDWVLRPGRVDSQLLFLTTKTEDDEKDRRPLLDEEHPDIPIWRSTLKRFNDFLRLQCIHIRASDVQMAEFAKTIAESRTRRGEKAVKPRMIQFGQVSLYRTFSSRLDLGGRFYGGFWQNLPKTMRPYIWINQWQAVECDFSGMAIRCLYAREGLPVPSDPYDIGLKYASGDDPRREIVKEYINSTINDKKNEYWIGPADLKALGLGRKELERRVMEVHRGIAHHFHTDAGLQMQYVDAQIAERVMLKMMDLGLVCLPIHDSFMVQAPFVAQLVRVMEESFTEVTQADALLKEVAPGVVQHYMETGFAQSQAATPAAVRARLEEEWERFSIANKYFGSWADQIWGEAGWEQAIREQDSVPDILLPHHAFPLRLFHRVEEK